MDECPDCGAEMERHDSTYSNIPSSKWYNCCTGVIYKCTNEDCGVYYIDSYIRGQIERWYY